MGMREVFEQAMRNKAARAADQDNSGPSGFMGKLIAQKRLKEAANPQISRGPVEEDPTGRAGPGSDIRMMSKKKGGKVTTKKMAAGGSASKRADGCATKGKTKGKFV